MIVKDAFINKKIKLKNYMCPAYYDPKADDEIYKKEQIESEIIIIKQSNDSTADISGSDQRSQEESVIS